MNTRPTRPDWPSAWAGARERLRRELGDAVFEAWIGPLTLESFDKDEVQIGAVKPFVRNWVANHYVPRIDRALRAEGTDPVSINIVLSAAKPVIGGNVVREPVRVETPVPVFGARHEDEGVGETKGLWTRMLHPQQTFDSFIPGPANLFGHGAGHRTDGRSRSSPRCRRGRW